MITRLLALRLFEAFSIQRWNDRIRPVDLTEMDKQGFKAMLTFIFAKMEEEKGKEVDWDYLVYGSVFALLKNIVLSDIKSYVIKEIKDKKEAYKELNKWVVNQYRPLISDQKFLKRFEQFLIEDDPKDNISLTILKAAHKYSTYREFEIIEASNVSNPQLSSIKKSLTCDLEKYYDLEAIKKLLLKQDLYEASCLIEQLRFQTRWSQTPRIPKTSVMGHSMYVACIMLFLSRELGACSKRVNNNFFGGLFHDLPEAVVRDIISPVKKATSDLPAIVKDIEDKVCSRELFPKLTDGTSKELKYLLGFDIKNCDEFSDRIIDSGMPRKIDNIKETITDFNKDIYSPVDGELIKLADEVAAFLEANQSINHGITSRHLQEGMAKIKFKYMDKKSINSIDVQSFFMNFD